MTIETYGRYQLLKRLAMGGMAQLYLARQPGPEGFEKLVVVKRILPHLAENDDFVKMFLDEARIAARLNHANVVQIFDLGAQDDSFFIAMEYIHGEDMRRVWKQSEAVGQPIPVPLVCRILIEACSGLDYAHKRTDPTTGKPLDIVHRDVSPQNILVTFEGGVKVVDFGIAKAADQATVTRSGVLKGKYSYMSPEQAAGQRVDRRSDIFALGVVLYELLTSTRLFKRPSDIQTLAAVAECKVVPPSQASPRVPQDLDAIVLKALSKDPADRYQEAAHLQLALEDWLTERRLPSSTAHVGAYMKEIYAERLASEARSGELLTEDSDPASGSGRQDPSSRRSGLRPALPPRSTGVPEGETAALRPRGTGKTGRIELESPSGRLTGQRRQVDPAPPDRSSRSGLGAVPAPPRVEEDAPTMDGRAASRATLTDVKIATEPKPADGRAASRVANPQAREPESHGVEGRAVTRPMPAFTHHVEEDAPTLAMPEMAGPLPRPSRLALPLPRGAEDLEEQEEDAPTLSLGMSRPGRKKGAAGRQAEASPPASRLGWWIPTVGLGLVVLVLLWGWLKPGSAVQAPARLESVPAGARVMFDGQELPERTPVTLPGMPEGRYSLVLSHEGYQELRTELEVQATGPVPLGVLRLVPVAQQAPVEKTAPVQAPVEPVAVAKVRLRVEAQPAQAVVIVDGRQQGAAPVMLEAAPGVALAVRVEAAKHQSSERTVTVGSGPEQVERFTLNPEARVVAPTPPPARPPRQEPRAETRTAKVRFAVRPWAEVTCGGKKLGETPFEAVELRVGTYDCKFFNPDLKKTLSRRIEVKAIDLNVVSVKFE
ncbi:protein kinase domain-containing protein [Myxococcus qinghaiensis]|uniref:protein kinase domain-containing protein n=1 Tax=Myxococcus qinghaiensis TaxID=2906758 RepID=UPI0020A6E672|nr:protein kinase [Myxococcus qinghaiensis]MCP3161587.1 protein kinase [Myxococcus qinghaiensis]